jgi:hypothetical protein
MLGQKPSRTTKFNVAISSTNGENIDEEGLMDIVAFARLQRLSTSEPRHHSKEQVHVRR